MTQTTSVEQPSPSRTRPPLIAWRNVLGATVVGWLIIALPNFAFLSTYLARTFSHDLVLASFYLDLGFLVSTVIVIGLVYWWQRAHGETLADLGWRRPTRIWVIIKAVIYGALWTATFYVSPGHLSFLAFPWERFIMAPLGIVLATAEELLFRGFLIEQLRRAAVPTWIQIITSGLTIASYHGLVGFHYFWQYTLSSFVLFGILAVLHIAGRRSMTPNTLAHAMTHFFGDPSALVELLTGVLRHL
jgi:membrane protease YdiL (CAAX protease family)